MVAVSYAWNMQNHRVTYNGITYHATVEELDDDWCEINVGNTCVHIYPQSRYGVIKYGCVNTLVVALAFCRDLYPHINII